MTKDPEELADLTVTQIENDFKSPHPSEWSEEDRQAIKKHIAEKVAEFQKNSPNEGTHVYANIARTHMEIIMSKPEFFAQVTKGEVISNIEGPSAKAEAKNPDRDAGFDLCQ